MKSVLACLAFGGVLIALAVDTSAYPQQQELPTQHQQLPTQHQQQQQPPLQNVVTEWCRSENGSVPYWLDPTCTTYVTCTNFNLTLEKCKEGLAYSFRQKACVEIDLVNCTDQNEQFILVLRKVVASTFYNNLPRPHLPFGAAAPADGENEEREEENSSNVPAGRAAAGGLGASTDEEEGAGDNAVLTVDLTDLPTIVVDSSNSFNVTLPSAMCHHLDDRVSQLEQSVNTVLLMLTGCPERACDVPLFHFDC